DVELRWPALAGRLAPEGAVEPGAGGDPDAGLPVAVALGELLPGVEAGAPVGPARLRRRQPVGPLHEDAAGDGVGRRVAPGGEVGRGVAPAEAVGPLGAVDGVAVELVVEGRHPQAAGGGDRTEEGGPLRRRPGKGKIRRWGARSANDSSGERRSSAGRAASRSSSTSPAAPTPPSSSTTSATGATGSTSSGAPSG